ncbi:MAG: cytochrome C oxidase subunit IV family protein [Desulfobacterales bacterium]|uniref:Cytochrome C oxidase subunit IV family protein n=1 Tax=Candidatus Desulfatibia vada TaxID=2841696 RepID=A0A8J6TJI6_9BACT|nr:cytochrome C oxidase subunit IV family protein [Candidatus Desulfatibia vada]
MRPLKNTDVHILSYKQLVAILSILLILTGTTVGVASIDLGAANIWAALGIAAIKSTFVLLYFMHLRYESRLLAGSLVLTLSVLAILIGFIFLDVAFR